jgi:hypothetical protein
LRPLWRGRVRKLGEQGVQAIPAIGTHARHARSVGPPR